MSNVSKGIYRRIYAGFLNGQRINAVSWKAEAWFWRLQALADDYGHLPGDPRKLAVAAAPRREVGTKEAANLTRELIEAGLVRPYEAEGQKFLAICPEEWMEIQPGNKNGKRVARFPHPASEAEKEWRSGESKNVVEVAPGESKVNPAPPIPIPIPIPIPSTTPTPIPSAEAAPPREGGREMTVGQLADAARASMAWDRGAAIARIVAAFPPSNGMPSPGKVREALYRLGGTSGEARFQGEGRVCGEEQAEAWLLGRVRAYAASVRVQTTPQDKLPSMSRWLAEGMYDLDDSAWATPYQRETAPEKPARRLG